MVEVFDFLFEVLIDGLRELLKISKLPKSIKSVIMFLIMTISIVSFILLFMLGFKTIEEDFIRGFLSFGMGLLVVAFIVFEFKKFYMEINN